jgi:hypothetical protein
MKNKVFNLKRGKVMKRTILFTTLFVFLGVGLAQAQWTSLGGRAQDVAVSAHTLWIVATDRTIQFWDNSKKAWCYHNGRSQMGDLIAVGPDNQPFVVDRNSNSRIFKSTSTYDGWLVIPGAEKAYNSIAVDGANRPWATLGAYDWKMFKYFDGTNWVQAPWDQHARGLAIEVNSNGTVVWMGNGGDLVIYKVTESPNNTNIGGVGSKDFDIDDSGNVWMIDASNNVCRHDGTKWETIDGIKGKRIAVSPSGIPYVVGMDGQVYCYGGTQPVSQANQPPLAPTNLFPCGSADSWGAPVQIDPYNGSILLHWQDNGDPEGDPLGFYIYIERYNFNSQQFELAWQGNVPQDLYLDNVYPGTRKGFNLTAQQGLASNSYYRWWVAAIDWNEQARNRGNQWYTWSQMAWFVTGGP